MKNVSMLLCACVGAAMHFAHAQDQPSLAALRAGCADDAQKLCQGVASGGGRIVACLKEHKDELSNQCRQAAGLPVNATPAPTAAASRNSSPAARPKPIAATHATATKTTFTAGQEKFVERYVTDTEHEGIRVATLHVPEKWRFQSTLQWHYDWPENPSIFHLQAENPGNAEAYFVYPLVRFDYIEIPPQARQYLKGVNTRPGERMPLGAIAAAPVPAMQALASFIKQTRPNVTNFKWLGQQSLPGLAKALRLAPWPNQQGVAIKIAYDLDGQPVEEAFFAVYYLAHATYPGVQLGIKQTNWGMQGLQSFRAPAGTLEKRMPMFCVMAKSYDINPKWARLAKAIDDKLKADFDQKMKQMDDQTHAALAVAAQTMREQASFQANFDKSEAAFRSSAGIDDSGLRDGGARSASDHWSDLMRGVDTVNDPSNGGTTQLSNLGHYHFTDGFGSYRTSDDPNYTPEKAGEVGSWTAMTEAP